MGIDCIRPTAEPFYGMTAFVFSFNALVLPQLMQHKVCRLTYNSTVCSHISSHPQIENGVQASTARWMSVLPLSALLPALFMVLMIGPISDVIGKKKTMIFPPFIYFIQSCIFIILTQIKTQYSPGLLLLPYGLSGLFGDNAGAAALAESYIACITSPENRTIRLAVLESCIFLGFLTGAIASGAIVGTLGFTAGFVATAIVNFINFVYVVFLVPSENSLRPELHHCELQRESDNDNAQEHIDRTCPHCKGRAAPPHHFTIRDVNPWRCLLRVKNAICKKDRRKKIAAILVLFAIALFINMGEVYMGILFIKHSPFNMKAKDIGLFTSMQAVLRGLGVIGTNYLCQRYLHFKDIGLVILGFCVQIIYFVSVGFSVSVLMLYLIQILAIPLVVHQPVFRSMVSKLVDDDQYGAAISAVEAVDVASSLLTSLVSNQIYSGTVKIFSGFAMCLLGVVAVFGLAGALTYYIVFIKSEKSDSEHEHLLQAHSSSALTNKDSSL